MPQILKNQYSFNRGKTVNRKEETTKNKDYIYKSREENNHKDSSTKSCKDDSKNREND